MPPTDQRFGADAPAIPQRDDRLVEKKELAGAQGPPDGLGIRFCRHVLRPTQPGTSMHEAV
jgi:hypothetical protein